MTPPGASGSWLRPELVVLSDRRPAPGAPRSGLEAAIEWALRERDGIWLAGEGEREGKREDVRERGRWSVLDGIPRPPASPADSWAGYASSNASYAERVIEVIRPGGMVWIHGDHWLLVASALRDHGHHGPIGLSLDAPFPAPARFEALPWCADVMAALDQLDLIGLRTPEHAANFEACRARAGRHRPAIAILPGDPLADSAAPARWAAELLRMLEAAGHRDPRRGFIA